MAYVYGHYRKDTKELFYVGKGTGKRAWSERHRNRYWKNVVNKHGFNVKILHDNLTDEEAFNKEKELIAEVGLENLTNMLDGGQGLSSEAAKERARQNSKNPEWIRKHKEEGRRKSQDEEFRRKNVELGRRLAQDPDWLRERTETNRRIAKDPEYRRKVSEGVRRKYQDPEYRRKVSEAAKQRWVKKRENENEKIQSDNNK
jgi:hypothetical protein